MLVNSSQSTVRSAAKADPAVPAQMAITMQTVKATATDAVRHRRMPWNECSFITPPWFCSWRNVPLGISPLNTLSSGPRCFLRSYEYITNKESLRSQAVHPARLDTRWLGRQLVPGQAQAIGVIHRWTSRSEKPKALKRLPEPRSRRKRSWPSKRMSPFRARHHDFRPMPVQAGSSSR